MFPLLVARKVQYATKIVFSKMGVLAFESYYQFFLPEYETNLQQAKHVDGLGFHDIKFTDQPTPHMSRYFAEHLDELLSTFWERFQSNKQLIAQYAKDEIDYDDLKEALGMVSFDQPEEMEDEPYDESDLY